MTYRIFILASIGSLAMSGALHAQDVGATTSTAEIIVEARRRDESVQDVPLVVNAVTAQQIEKLNLRRFDEIAAVVPGLLMDPNGSVVGASSSMRGVRHDILTTGENGTIQYYLGDAPVPTIFVFQSMYDIGQVEVLRGPQGTLRGRATPSGSITITTRQPDLSEVGAYMSGALATGDARNFQFGINVPIIADKLAVRVAGVHDFNRGDRIRSLANSIDPRKETNSLRATVRFEPVDFLKFGFMHQTLDMKSLRYNQTQSYDLLVPGFAPNASPVSPLANPDSANFGTIRPNDRVSVANTPMEAEQKIKFYNWNAEVSQAGQRLIYVGSRQLAQLPAVQPQDVNNFFPANTFAQRLTTDEKQTTHEIRLQNDDRLFGMFDYVLGYFTTKYVASTNLTNPTFIGFLNFVANTAIGALPATQKERAIFGNATVHLGEATEVSGGLRRISFKSNYPSLLINGSPQPNSASAKDVHATIYTASLKRRFSENIMAYASTGSSWRPPLDVIGNFTVAPLSPLERAHVSLPPETSKSYEVGVKSNWFDNRITANLTYFHQTFKNYPFRPSGAGIYYVNYAAQAPNVPSIGQFGFLSPVPVKVDGVEAELGVRPSDRLSFNATLTWTHSRMGAARLACLDANKDGIPDTGFPASGAALQAAYGAEHLAECPSSGKNPSFQPDWAGSAQAEYALPVGAIGNAYLRGLVSWRGGAINDPDNRFDDVGAYALLNLFAGLRGADDSWEVSVFAKNVFNTKRIVTRNDTAYQASSVPSPLVGRYSGLTMTLPREVGVTMRVAIGSR